LVLEKCRFVRYSTNLQLAAWEREKTMSEEEKPILIRIDWGADDSFHFSLSNHVVVNHDTDNFYIRFYQITPPVRTDKSLPVPESIKAKLVSGAAIPLSQMNTFINALRENLEVYQRRMNGIGEDEDGDGAL